MTHRSCLSDSL